MRRRGILSQAVRSYSKHLAAVDLPHGLKAKLIAQLKRDVAHDAMRFMGDHDMPKVAKLLGVSVSTLYRLRKL